VSNGASNNSLSVELRRQIDSVCEAFCAEWNEGRGGRVPHIEDFVNRVAVEGRSEALRRLLSAELEFRTRQQHRISFDDYYERFPNDHQDLNTVIGDVSDVELSTDHPSTSVAGKDGSSPQVPLAEESGPVPTRIGNYVIESVLGNGAFGRVYRARDTNLNRLVAIKGPSPRRWAELKQELADRFQSHGASRIMDDFLTEARNAASLKHPGLVTVHDFQIDDGRPYIVQELIEGGSLSTWARRESPGDRQVVAMMIEIVEAISYAHQQGFVHRDLKPANILVDDHGHPHVTDFGLAIHESVQLQSMGQVSGTLPYMSPEQIRGESHRLDGRSDLWSLGIIFYELLTGDRPFRGAGDDLTDQIEFASPRPPRQRRPNLAGELERICLKCLEKRVIDRYSSAIVLIDDLKNWLDGAISTEQTSDTNVIAETPSLNDEEVRIVPKGLRSFDEHDADFFLTLLPGPRDRTGLPESIRFWKSRLEDTDPDNTFPVGVLYGPSGCGKSSLMKAGLLPRLAPHVLRIYIEATPNDTESRLLSGLKTQFPDLPNVSLPEAFRWIRERRIPGGGKLLIVIDQFEQWIHAHGSDPSSMLVDALRQCDGGHVQSVVMLRDDFWMAATRFMRDLDARLIEGVNSGAVDLFPLRHARDVLIQFGRAFGVLDASDEITVEQTQFVTDAINGLAQDQKVICVRLALFADMMKEKPWTPDSLRAVGGAKGVGATFLEETFYAAQAPPEHRLHQRAAQDILRAHLPDGDVNNKGQIRTPDAYLQPSG